MLTAGAYLAEAASLKVQRKVNRSLATPPVISKAPPFKLHRWRAAAHHLSVATFVKNNTSQLCSHTINKCL